MRTNLPAQLSSFVGRSDVVADVRALLAADRGITLTGAGGCGKTRLALHVAAGLTDSYEGVWLVDFAPVNDPDAEMRKRRLNLLARFRDLVDAVADFSKIEG